MDLNVRNWHVDLSGGRRAQLEVLESHAGTLAALPSASGSLGPLPAPLQGKKQLLVLFPGNPGVVHFYDQFVLQLARRTPGLVVLVMGFVGHAIGKAPVPSSGRHLTMSGSLFPREIDGTSDDDVFVLQDQLEAADDFLRRLVFNAPDATKPPPLIAEAGFEVSVAGHSIGSYVAMHMAVRFPSIKTALLLTPTIMEMADTPNGRQNHWGLAPLSVWAISSLVVPALGCLPAGAQRAVVNLAEPRMTAPHRRIVGAMNQPRIVRNVLTLARSEFRQLGKLDVAMLRRLGARAVCYCTHGDGWVPLRHVGEIHAACPAVAVHVEHDRHVKHAWCCYNAEAVAAWCAARLRGDPVASPSDPLADAKPHRDSH